MKRFKKVPSECLIWKLDWKPSDEREAGKPCVGDVIPGIMKYEKPIPAQLAGQVLGAFPTHLVPKTDEPNFQTVPDMIAAIMGEKFYATEKADGSSGTAFMKANEHFGVCSRNLELKPNKDNAFWAMVYKYDINNSLPNDYSIQFELVGPGIQKNHLGLSEIDIRVFNVWNIRERRFLNIEQAMELACGEMNLPWAEMIEYDGVFDFANDEAMRKYAEGKYPNGGQREGVVIRPMKETMVNGERLSFKIINLKFKD
jgi:RNA ligase (TIGR02306 family)